MALLLLSKCITNRYKLFNHRTVSTNEIIVASVSKCLYESLLIKTEFTCYSHYLSAFTMIDTLYPSNQSSENLIILNIMCSIIATHPYIIPTFNTSYNIYKKNTKIIKIDFFK